MKKIFLIAILILGQNTLIQNVFAKSNCRKAGFKLWGQEIYATPNGTSMIWAPMQEVWSTALFGPGEIGVASRKEIPKDLKLELVYLSHKTNEKLLEEEMLVIQDSKKREQFKSNFAHTTKKLAPFLDKALKLSDKGNLLITLKSKGKKLCTFEQEVFIAWDNMDSMDSDSMDSE